VGRKLTGLNSGEGVDVFKKLGGRGGGQKCQVFHKGWRKRGGKRSYRKQSKRGIRGSADIRNLEESTKKLRALYCTVF